MKKTFKPTISNMLTCHENSGSKLFCSDYFNVMITDLRSCSMSLALNIVIKDVVAAGMMMMGVLEPKRDKKHYINSNISCRWAQID